MMKKYFGVDDVMAYGPCEEYTRERVAALWGNRPKLTALEIARLDVPLPDILYAFRKLEALTRKQWVAFAVACARQCLHVFEASFPDDDRPRKAIEAAERCLRRDSVANRAAAARAARAAARAASYAAAAMAASADASYAAASYAAASYAASYAARAAAGSEQRGFLIEILGGNQ